jgi:transposase InsO family protein
MLREWAYAQPYPSSSARAQQLPRWLHHYNHTRLHGSLRPQATHQRPHGLNNLRGNYT